MILHNGIPGRPLCRRNYCHASVLTLAFTLALALTSLLLVAGCTMTPAGENSLRRQAITTGKPFEKPYVKRHIPPLAPNVTPSQMVRYALLNNPDVEAAYWKFRAAIENIPQAGTESTTPMLSGVGGIQNGSFSAANSSLGIANMGSAPIQWPSKPLASAKIALQKARAAEWTFRRSQFSLRRSVLDAWYSYARTAVLLNLAKRDLKLSVELQMIASANVQIGKDPAELLAAQNRITVLRTRIIALQQELPQKLAMINRWLGRKPDAPLDIPAHLPKVQELRISDSRILAIAARRNPALAELRRLSAGEKISIYRAKLQYVPNFNLGASFSLDGIMQNLSGAIMFPIVRYQAINASIRQARYRLRDVYSRERATYDLISQRLIVDLLALKSDREQLHLLNYSLLPRIREIAAFSAANFEQGGASISGQVQARRLDLNVQRMVADLQTDALDRIADIDAIIAVPL